MFYNIGECNNTLLFFGTFMTEDNEKQILEYAEKKNLSTTPVHEFMTKGVLKVGKDSSIKSVISMFKEHKISGAPVIDENERMVGIITGYDLILQAATRDLDDVILFNRGVVSIRIEDTLATAIKSLHKTKFHRLPVVNSLGHAVGIISQQDILNELIVLAQE